MKLEVCLLLLPCVVVYLLTTNGSERRYVRRLSEERTAAEVVEVADAAVQYNERMYDGCVHCVAV